MRRRPLCARAARAPGRSARAAPFVPNDDEQILERLPPRTGAEWDVIRALRAAFAADSSSAELAAELARRYLELFRVEGDPRLVAYAKTAHRAVVGRRRAAGRGRAGARACRANRASVRGRGDRSHQRLTARAPRDAASVAHARCDGARARRRCGEPASVRPRAAARGSVRRRRVLCRVASDDGSRRSRPTIS